MSEQAKGNCIMVNKIYSTLFGLPPANNIKIIFAI